MLRIRLGVLRLNRAGWVRRLWGVVVQVGFHVGTERVALANR